MAVKFKLYGGATPNSNTHLCETCTYQDRVTNDRGEKLQVCNRFEREIGRNIVECNRHLDRNHPSVNGMNEIAWILTTDSKSQKKIGFVSPQEWQKKNPFNSPTPD